MIHVYYDNTGFVVRGHADWDVKGKDIVCSAVSSLAQSVLLTLEKYEAVQDSYVRDGKMSVITDMEDSFVNVIVDVLILGATAIAREYPNHVKVQYLGGLKDE